MISKKCKDEVRKILDSNELSGYKGNAGDCFKGGKWIQKLEKMCEKKFRSKNAIAINSATSGLFVALAASIGIQDLTKYWEKKEVIVTPYSMTCSASIPLWLGINPVFADIEKDFFCLDPKSVIKKINKKTAAIIAVDLFGMPFSKEINQIAKDNGIIVIEDAAQAIGAKRHKKYAGTLGDIGVLSFNQHKHVQAGEGGILLTNDEVFAEKIRLLINHAEAVINDSITYRIDYKGLFGLNLRMTEIQACIICHQLINLDSTIAKYRKYAEPFNIPLRDGCTSSYYKYATIGEPKVDKDIYETKKGYITPINRMPLFNSLHYRLNTPNCDKVEKNIYISSLKGGNI